jgi:protoporphyrin/coproporphyrin ferrochelatase
MSRYQGNADFVHDSTECLGVLMVNLGTPDAPDTKAVRRYLAEFLADPRVIEFPRLLWLVILHSIILRTRPRRSAHAYSKVWTTEGSPLLAITLTQAKALQMALDEQTAGNVKVVAAMRYGKPSIAAGLETLRQANVRRLLILPLYPQYSATTTASVFDAVADVLKTWRWLPEVRFINDYYDDPDYIAAWTDYLADSWSREKRAERVLFSFHGLPEQYFKNGDPYFCHCHKSARLIAERLALPEDTWQVTFQSRFGPKEWLKPYTDMTLQEWGKQGIASVDVVCPGFAADCLETLEEINILNRQFFLDAGGKQFRYIPALNDHPLHIKLLLALVKKHTQGWPEMAVIGDGQDVVFDLPGRKTRALALGAGN